MTAITFDTLAFSKQLQESGMPQAQAEALAKAQKEAFNELVQAKDFATKQDIVNAEVALKQSIAENKKDIIQMKYDLLKWQLSIGFALVVIMAKGFGWLGF